MVGGEGRVGTRAGGPLVEVLLEGVDAAELKMRNLGKRKKYRR